MKTLLQSKYLKRLAALNDQLCFFQFSRNELEASLKNLSVESYEQYTDKVFPNNLMAPRIHVLVKDLITFQEANQYINFATYFAICYEVLANYLVESFIEIQNFSSSQFTQRNHNELEEKFNLTLTSSGYPPIPHEIIFTIKYLRLRRNHFTHLSETADQYLTSIIQTNGSLLNTYWANAIQNLDFTSLDIFDYSEEETIELIKIIRILLERLDVFIASGFSKIKIAEYSANKLFINPQRLNTIIIEERIRKTRTFAKFEFNIDIDNQIILPIVSNIAKK